MSDRLPTSVYVDAVLTRLNTQGVYYHFVQKGDLSSGLVMLKLNSLGGQVKLVIQERDFDTGVLQWAQALEKEVVEEVAADAYIERAIARDPDIWVIEIEDRAMNNPFEE